MSAISPVPPVASAPPHPGRGCLRTSAWLRHPPADLIHYGPDGRPATALPVGPQQGAVGGHRPPCCRRSGWWGAEKRPRGEIAGALLRVGAGGVLQAAATSGFPP